LAGWRTHAPRKRLRVPSRHTQATAHCVENHKQDNERLSAGHPRARGRLAIIVGWRQPVEIIPCGVACGRLSTHDDCKTLTWASSPPANSLALLRCWSHKRKPPHARARLMREHSQGSGSGLICCYRRRSDSGMGLISLLLLWSVLLVHRLRIVCTERLCMIRLPRAYVQKNQASWTPVLLPMDNDYPQLLPLVENLSSI
jgi:hypothetical protein